MKEGTKEAKEKLEEEIAFCGPHRVHGENGRNTSQMMNNHKKSSTKRIFSLHKTVQISAQGPCKILTVLNNMNCNRAACCETFKYKC